jgi:hypothetical protein
MKTLTSCVLLVLLIAMVSSIASAQTNDVFWTNYYSNANAPGVPAREIRITNPGAQAGNRGSFSKPGPGSLCAMEYSFTADQQLTVCCGCLITPNGLQTREPSGTTLTGGPANDGVLQIVSAAPNSTSSATAIFPDNSPFCDPTAPYTPTPDLRVWVTHLQNPVARIFPETETPSLPAPLSASEEGWLQGNCNFAVIQGSGQGICDCGQFEK